MARKPSERTNRQYGDDELNLTSLMDLITTLMFFLLIFANMIPVVTIEAPLPKVASTAEEVRKAKNDQNELEVIIRIRNSGFVVQSQQFGTRNFGLTGDGKLPYEGLHRYLVSMHQKRPKAKDVTVIPADDVKYDVLVKVMDAAREYYKKDPGFKDVPADMVGTLEGSRYNHMFPHVTIGGV